VRSGRRIGQGGWSRLNSTEWTKVTSLVDGIAGLHSPDRNLVGPIRLDFRFASGFLSKPFFRLVNMNIPGTKETMPIPAATTIRFFGNPVELILTDGSLYTHKGKILLATASGSQHGTIRIVAAFQILATFCGRASRRVRVETSMKKRRSLLPQSAVASRREAIRWQLSAAITKSVCAP